MRANGTGLRVLASSRPGDTTPSWSPDGRRLAVRGFGLARSFDLYTIAVTGTARTRLLATRANELYPSWSSDGRTIAYQSDRSGGIQIWTLTLSGRGSASSPAASRARCPTSRRAAARSRSSAAAGSG